MASIEELRNVRLEKLEKLREKGIDPYPATVTRTHTVQEARDNFDTLTDAEETISLVGRVRALRVHGGSTFIDIEDQTGQFQLFCEEDALGKDTYQIVSELTDIGDFIEVTGTLFTTKRDAQTLSANEFRIITKALRPIPEEHFGLKDAEERLRRRYLDLIVNKEVRNLFRKKAAFWHSTRAFLDSNSFLEVDTPALQDVPGGADATPFITHHEALDRDFYLRISLELPLKKLIVGGFEKVYEIGKVFRNEGISAEHLQDYQMCEFYWAYADYNDMMELVEEMMTTVVKETTGALVTQRGGKEIDWSAPWPRKDYFDVIEEHLDTRLDTLSESELRTYATELGVEIEDEWDRGRVLDYIWKKKVRPHITNPVFVTHHPIEVSPLAKRLVNDPQQVQRLQVVAAGTELGNGWSELNDPMDQRERFEYQQRLREKGDTEAQMKDEAFLEALEYGMPPTAGFGFSERLFAVLMDKSVRETTTFPPMRREAPEDRG